LPETSGAGCAFLDYDNDGWMDIYLVNSGKADFYTPPRPLRNELYRNNRDGTFTDVTEKAGVAGGGYGMGVAVGDYNGDGFPDLYVTQFGRNILYRNNGDGTFTDVSRESGIAEHRGKAWGVVATDLNNDGRMDLFVSNDTVANFLFMNRDGKRFSEDGFAAGVAYSGEGRARSGMGVDSADFNNDGWMDLFVANIDEEIFSLYQNNHDGTFDDVAMQQGIGMATRWMSGWGLKFFDYDNDGNVDLILSNGFPDDLVDQISNKVTYREPLLLFHNDGRSFKDVSQQSGPVFMKNFAARGLAIGDFNNDGAVDVLISVNDGAPVLLRNNAAKSNRWLGLKLLGRKSNPDAIGARVTYQAGDLNRTRMKVGGGSFLSSHDPRIVLGLGEHSKVDWLEVHWPEPGGAVERFTGLPADQYVTIVEGTGKWK
jgi:enediyne biosynthesis protein E4